MLRLDTLDVLHQCLQADDVATQDLITMLGMTRGGTVAVQHRLIKAGLLTRTPTALGNVVGYTYHTTDKGVQLLKAYALLLKGYYEPSTAARCPDTQ